MGFGAAFDLKSLREFAASAAGHRTGGTEGELRGMSYFGIPAWVFAVAASAVIALAFVWLESGGSKSPELARDYEDCVERMQVRGVSEDEHNAMMTACGARFAARRKPDGSGYSYYDFMQDKKFDIAGPNPTADERKTIDRAYITYLEGQRREAVSAALAQQQNDKLRADIENARQPAGPPLSLLPANVPLPVPRRVAEQRGRAHCTEETLSCKLSKLSSAVKDAFASATRTTASPAR